MKHTDYVNHLRALHSASKRSVTCQLKGCNRDFIGVSQLEVHLKNAHRNKKSSIAIRQSQLVDKLTSLKCLAVSCGHQEVPTLRELKKHINTHLDRRENVECIFAGCDFKTNNIGSFKSHISRKHQSDDADALKSDICSQQILLEESDDPTNLISDIGETYDEVYQDEDIVDSSLDGEDEESSDRFQESDSEELFIKALAITFCDWANVKHIPYTTCNEIVKEVFKSYGMATDLVRLKISDLLVNEGLNSEQVDRIFEELNQEDPFVRAKNELEQESKRLNFLKNTFHYSEPETIYLPTEKGKPKESYQYVPIKESLKLILEDETYLKQKGEDPYYYEEGHIKDIRDGEVFRNNEFFQRNPEAVPLLTFQDELEGQGPCQDFIFHFLSQLK